MQVVTLKPFYHRGEECIGVYFNHEHKIEAVVKRVPKAKWSYTNKCWYMPCKQEACKLLMDGCSAGLRVSEIVHLLRHGYVCI